MNPALIPNRPISFLRNFASRGGAAIRALLSEVAGRWRHAVARRELHDLPDWMLRDLGIGRSELDSYWAEAHGRTERTRLRILRNRTGGGL